MSRTSIPKGESPTTYLTRNMWRSNLDRARVLCALYHGRWPTLESVINDALDIGLAQLTKDSRKANFNNRKKAATSGKGK